MWMSEAEHSSFLASSVVTVSLAPFSSNTFSLPTVMPVRISGPLVSSAMASRRPSSGVSSTDLRALAITSPWYSYEPCEKFMRTMFMPASRSLVSISTDLVLGPMVQMMPVARLLLACE